MGGLVDQPDGSRQWEVATIANKAAGQDGDRVSIRYLGVWISLGLDWSTNTGKLKSKVGCVIARLRQAGTPYTVINEVVRTMVASRVAFSAQRWRQCQTKSLRNGGSGPQP